MRMIRKKEHVDVRRRVGNQTRKVQYHCRTRHTNKVDVNERDIVTATTTVHFP